MNVPKRTFTPFGLLRLQNPQQRPPNGASSNEQPSEPARIVDVERQKYLTPNTGRVAPEKGTAVRPGARLVRDWQGRSYVVTATEGGFNYDGKTYGSLTAIAQRITGAHWSGPRFFGLRPSGDRTTGAAAAAGRG